MDLNFSSIMGPIGSAGYNTTGFPDPFTDQASIAMPETPVHMLRWCEYIVMTQGHYRAAISRVLSYFINEVQISNASDDEKQKYGEYLNNTLGIYNVLQQVGLDYLVYGNSFISVVQPFKRYLICPKCYINHPLNVVYEYPEFKFKWSNFEFHATCPQCKYAGKWLVNDRKGNADDIRVKRWNPHEIEILHDILTEDSAYIWKIPADYKQQILKGKLFQLERVNLEIIEAIKNDRYFRFNPEAIFHLKEETLAGIRNRSWGISRVFSNFRQSFYVQVLHRQNEGIALDYVIPFRVITPSSVGGAGSELKDPVLNYAGFDVVSKLNAMLRRRRRDPASWNVLPFAIDYKALGGDAKQFAPKELLDQGIELQLNNIGIPVEMFKGTLQMQTAPAALRLFESQWTHLVHNLNKFLRYLALRLSVILKWDRVHISLVKASISEDINKQMAKLQLMTSQQISQQTGLASIGITDWREEFRRMLDEQKVKAEMQQTMQEEMQRKQDQQQLAMPPQQGGAPGQSQDPSQAQGGGQAPPQQGGGQPAPGQPGMPPASPVDQFLANSPMDPSIKISPQELMQRAQTLAQQILMLPESQKDSELIKLKRKDETLHALVSSYIKSYKQQARASGGAMLMSQQGIGGGGQPAQ